MCELVLCRIRHFYKHVSNGSRIQRVMSFDRCVGTHTRLTDCDVKKTPLRCAVCVCVCRVCMCMVACTNKCLVLVKDLALLRLLPRYKSSCLFLSKNGFPLSFCCKRQQKEPSLHTKQTSINQQQQRLPHKSSTQPH
jgi:hypothetical protein